MPVRILPNKKISDTKKEMEMELTHRALHVRRQHQQGNV